MSNDLKKMTIENNEEVLACAQSYEDVCIELKDIENKLAIQWGIDPETVHNCLVNHYKCFQETSLLYDWQETYISFLNWSKEKLSMIDIKELMEEVGEFTIISVEVCFVETDIGNFLWYSTPNRNTIHCFNGNFKEACTGYNVLHSRNQGRYLGIMKLNDHNPAHNSPSLGPPIGQKDFLLSEIDRQKIFLSNIKMECQKKIDAKQKEIDELELKCNSST